MSIQTLIDSLVATWPSEIDALANAVALAAPMLVILFVLWLCAVGGQWLIDRYTASRPPSMRMADADQIERETQQLWQHWHDTVSPDDERPRLRAGTHQLRQAADDDERRRA